MLLTEKGQKFVTIKMKVTAENTEIKINWSGEAPLHNHAKQSSSGSYTEGKYTKQVDEGGNFPLCEKKPYCKNHQLPKQTNPKLTKTQTQFGMYDLFARWGIMKYFIKFSAVWFPILPWLTSEKKLNKFPLRKQVI